MTKVHLNKHQLAFNFKQTILRTISILLFLSVGLTSFTQVWGDGVNAIKYSSGPYAYASFKKNGGVVFYEIANPYDGLENTSITIAYHAEKPDGQRLSIKLGNSQDSIYFPEIYDWELIPIANFANSGDAVAVTLIGERKIHESFQNTLLGKRLYQSDLLYAEPYLLMNQFLDTETEEVFFAQSEIENGNTLAKDELTNVADNLYEFTGFDYSTEDWTNYIFTDWRENIQFKVVDNEFLITGEPYFQFQKSEIDWNAYQLKICNILNDVQYFNELEKLTTEDLEKLKVLCENNKSYSWTGKQIYTHINNVEEQLIYDYEGYISEIKNLIQKIEAKSDTAFLSNSYWNNLKKLTTQEMSLEVAALLEREFFLNIVDNPVFYNYDYLKYNQQVCELANFLNTSIVYEGISKKEELISICKICLEKPSMGNGQLLKAQITLWDDYFYEYQILADFKEIELYVQNPVIEQLGEVELKMINSPFLTKLEETNLSEKKVKLLMELTNKAKEDRSKIHSIIPTIIDAGTQTMRYTAFFRYVRYKSPYNWEQFIAKIKDVKPVEDIGTETPADLNK